MTFDPFYCLNHHECGFLRHLTPKSAIIEIFWTIRTLQKLKSEPNYPFTKYFETNIYQYIPSKPNVGSNCNPRILFQVKANQISIEIYIFSRNYAKYKPDYIINLKSNISIQL